MAVTQQSIFDENLALKIFTPSNWVMQIFFMQVFLFFYHKNGLIDDKKYTLSDFSLIIKL